jgi:nucleoside-diphosphate-sugar epimerase
MALVVTGASGFFGSNFLNQAREPGGHIYCLTRHPERKNLAKRSKNIKWVCADSFLGKAPPEHISAILHAATCYDRTSSPDEVFEANVQLCRDLVNYARQYNVRKFINLDSFYAQPRNIGHVHGLSEYTRTKTIARQYLQSVQGDLHIVNLVIAHMYGPLDREEKLIPRVLRDLQEGREIEVHDPSQLRDFVFVDDVARAAIATITSAGKDTGFHQSAVRSGTTTSILEMIETAKLITDSKSPIFKGPFISGENLVWDFGNSDYLHQLGWRPETDLSAGLKRTMKGRARAED